MQSLRPRVAGARRSDVRRRAGRTLGDTLAARIEGDNGPPPGPARFPDGLTGPGHPVHHWRTRHSEDKRERGGFAEMPHDHHHHHHGPVTGRRLGLSIALTLAFVLGEAAAGFWAQSLALVSDAGHNLADALALIFSWYAIRLARRPSHARLTFGYHRAGIL